MKILLFAFVLIIASSQAAIKKVEIFCDVLGHQNMSSQIVVFANEYSGATEYITVTLTSSDQSNFWRLPRQGSRLIPVYEQGDTSLRPWLDEGADYPTFRTNGKWYEFYCHTYNDKL